MRRIAKYLLFFSILNFSFCFAQNPDIKRTYHWYFGDDAGIDFNSGSPVADINSSMYAMEGCASISDTSGNLLFYTNGDTVWNKNHQVMPMGTGLLGCISSSQSAIIIPKPQSSNIYYIFTTDCTEDTCQSGTRFSIVDMNLDGGLGDVTTKNIILLAPSTEHLAGVKAANCIDVWLMTHDLTGNSFYAFQVTPAGVNTSPVISTIGDPNFPGFNGFWWGDVGYFKFSPDAQKFVSIRFFDAIANTFLFKSLELFDFNNSTGVLSNYIGLATDSGLYGGTFSPDNSKFYVTLNNSIYQYDLLAGGPSNIINSKQIVYTSNNINNSFYWAMQVGLDGKIYVARITNTSSDSLAVINNPNVLGAACNAIDNGFYLGGRSSTAGLPNFIESYFDTISCLTSVNENNNSQSNVLIYPNPFNTSALIVVTNIEPQNYFSISLYDELGSEQKIDIGSTEFDNNSLKIKINRGNLISGVYFLKIKTDNNSYSQKLIITN